ncbi:MAG: prepilin-type N-terminal cleavage/methylation domain-containing protein [Verrucomicrobia bacterium]|nr:prepilin-type N-terminal cleavage/methylation domain-containing protein [Verrucomicrobiota bacterium]
MPLVAPPSSRKRSSGFTLTEAMIATSVFALCTLGIYQCIIMSYKMTSVARYSDNARAVIRSFADQFQRLSIRDESNATLWLFYPTAGETGRGLVWGSLSNVAESTALTDTPYITVPIGPAGHTLDARVSRELQYVDTTTGASSATPASDAAGFMLQATFRIRYTLNQHTYTHTLTAMRVGP